MCEVCDPKLNPKPGTEVGEEKLWISYICILLKLLTIKRLSSLCHTHSPSSNSEIVWSKTAVLLINPDLHQSCLKNFISEVIMKMLFCYVRRFRVYLDAIEELHFSVFISLLPPFRCRRCNVSFLLGHKKQLNTDLDIDYHGKC